MLPFKSFAFVPALLRIGELDGPATAGILRPCFSVVMCADALLEIGR